MRIYLAGPMRGLPEFNFPAFDRAAVELREYGHEVFNPAERDRVAGFSTEGLTGHEDLAAMGFSLRDALAADTEYIAKRADAVALLPGWEKSSGVAAEIALAHALGLPVGDIADFDEDGPHTTLEAPHGASGTIPQPGDADEIQAAAERFFAIWDPKAAAERVGRRTSASYEEEIRTTSVTGGEKGTKPERYDLIPVGALAQVAQLYGRGAAKYAAHNWRRGYEWSKSYAALQRHATQFWNGEDNDPEMGLPHMASVAFHALALLTFMEEQRGFDDRYKAGA